MENQIIKLEDYTLSLKNDTLTIYYSVFNEETHIDDVDCDSHSEDAIEFKSWVLETVKEDDRFDLGGVLPNGLTFLDFWHTLTASQQKEWVKEYFEVLVSESVITKFQQFSVAA